ncbi:hypothetical protein AB1N83_010654 [Pleurotus pulmonarius]
MHVLPPEILFTIVGELDVNEHGDHKTLRSLLFVSKQVNPFALCATYRDLSFAPPSSPLQYHLIAKLRLLSRDVKSNPGLQFTTTFSCIMKRRFGDIENHTDEINSLLGHIIPFLANVRRVTISLQESPIDTRILRSLPLGAPLAYLKLEQCSLSSDHLRQLLASHPTLEWLDIYSPTRPQSFEQSNLTINALPRLLSLSITANNTVFFECPLSSLVNLDLDALHMSSMDDALIVQRMVPFASITACHLSNVYFVKVLPILECLPLLEYLWLGRTTLKMQEDTNSVSLPATLKYLRCYVYSEPAVPFGRRMFDSIKTLVVVDITSQPNQSTIRMRHGNYQGPVFYQSGAWTRWWENAKRAVELAGPAAYRSAP